MTLLIVESPTKARTLSKFLGSGYDVQATMGHIKDLPKSKLGVDVKKNFEPNYEVVEKRSKEINKITSLAKKAKDIYIATDPDREGEAIASHVEEIIKEKNKNAHMQRIVFHEITKGAVEEAISHPRKVDTNLVDAQIGRRVLDRLVGYNLSPLLWRKVRRGLSAGRVQSVAVRLIVEREREIEAFKSKEYWEIYVDLKTKSAKDFTVQLIKVKDKKTEVGDGKTAEKIVTDLEKAKYFVLEVKKREVRKNPYPPFTTSTMTQGAARMFGWSAKRTMQVAQSLYENGLITYHRTDSTNIAAVALSASREFIKLNYGDQYLPETPRIYKTKAKVAQEAHEAIRPTDLKTDLKTKAEKLESAQNKLYSLIWKRFMASQMSQSIYDETTIDVGADGYLLRASGQVMKFDGWRKVYGGVNEDDVAILPEVEKDEPLQLIKVNPFQKFTLPPARYNEASIIKTLEKLGIGRPSTYAPTISTIQLRGYVEKKEGKFFATAVGIAVNDFLMKYFAEVVDYDFTATMEDNLDKIADGKLKWVTTIKDFYKPFESKLETVGEKAERVKIAVEKLGKKCPDCEEGELVIRTGRFGKFISCSRFPDCKHTEKYQEKIEMKCPDCGKGDVVVKRTRKGRTFYGCSRYPDCKFASWKKPQLDKESSKDIVE